MNILDFFKNLFKKEKPKEKEEEKMLLTIDQLYNINNNLNKADCEYYINALNRVLPLYGINTPLRLAHFLAQVLHESGHLKYKSENLNYSAQALLKVFPKYFKTTADANAYARQPVKIANRVYANRMGNGNEASGEGWKYRGRGLLQITGRSNYEQCGKYINSDLMHYPDSILGDPDLNVKVACWYWTTRNLNQFADNDDIVTITKKINGGLNGLQDRTTVLQKAKLILNC
ncbi:MAG: glycoside hydrolase family 19 protein [Bacilli bacterium]|nr:glycoside hydrolase family 19 protein [Clostridia bacterium]MBR4618035.1 glycoside hydrolase family 19 protein [Bacilli bacterium]